MYTDDHPAIGIIDDDIAYIRLMERVLSSAGFRPCAITTPDVDEAARVAGSASCRAVLVDILMYGRPAGFEYVTALKSHPSTANIPIVVTSGSTRHLKEMATFLAGSRSATFAKPFDPAALVTHLRSIGSPAIRESAETPIV